MNKQRRQRIDAIKDQLLAIQTALEVLRDEVQDSLENLPECLQLADVGVWIEAALDAIDNAIDLIESVNDELDKAKGES